MQFYPKGRQQERPSIQDPTIRSRRLGVLRAAGINLLLLQVLFLGLFCYLFGSLFQQTTHIHNLNILFVDYDGGAIGEAVRAAYRELRGLGFPTLIEQPSSLYPEPESIRNAVCNIKYWAGLYTTSGASNRLSAAFNGGSAASAYNKSDVLTLIWNEARYSTVVDSAIFNNMETLSEAARVAYSNMNGRQIFQTLNSSDPAAIAAFSDPWILSSINIQQTTQGSRLIYNTLVVILIMIQEFFYLGTINGVYQQFKLYTSVSPTRIAIFRLMISGTYTIIGSLCTAGAIWAFRNGWDVHGGQFALTWMALWLFAHLNFLLLDVFTIWIPAPFVPMALITWLMFNVGSVLLPFELAPGFYKWAYAIPAHAVFQVLVDIWSDGCNPQLASSLPVLFAYELVAGCLSTIGVYRRAHYAVIAKEGEEKSWQERINAAILEHQEGQPVEEKGSLEPSETGTSAREEEGEGRRWNRRGTLATLSDQEELGGRIMREMSKIDRTATTRESTGPCFDLPFAE